MQPNAILVDRISITHSVLSLKSSVTWSPREVVEIDEFRLTRESGGRSPRSATEITLRRWLHGAIVPASNGGQTL
jgi:hypothetical protein